MAASDEGSHEYTAGALVITSRPAFPAQRKRLLVLCVLVDISSPLFNALASYETIALSNARRFILFSP